MVGCIVENNIITNVIEIPDESSPNEFNAFPLPQNKWIGDMYDDTPSIKESVEKIAQTVQSNEYSAAILFSRIMVQTASLTPDQTIQVSALYPEWTLGSYKVGDIRLATYQGTHQPWKCRQDHDTTTYPDITPDGTAWRTFWIPFHGTTPETAQGWIAPGGAHDQYEAGEYMIWTDGNTYQCKENTAYSPEEYGRAWELYSE